MYESVSFINHNRLQFIMNRLCEIMNLGVVSRTKKRENDQRGRWTNQGEGKEARTLCVVSLHILKFYKRVTMDHSDQTSLQTLSSIKGIGINSCHISMINNLFIWSNLLDTTPTIILSLTDCQVFCFHQSISTQIYQHIQNRIKGEIILNYHQKKSIFITNNNIQDLLLYTLQIYKPFNIKQSTPWCTFIDQRFINHNNVLLSNKCKYSLQHCNDNIFSFWLAFLNINSPIRISIKSYVPDCSPPECNS